MNFNRFILVLAIIGAALGIVGVFLTFYLRSPIDGLKIPGLDMIRHLTHPSGEATVYSWFSVALLLGVALGFAVIALASWRTPGLPWRYGVLAATAALLSADEAALLHEKMANAASALGLSWSWTYSWLIVAVPLAALAGVFLIWVARAINSLLRKRLIIAGVVFLLGAVVMEVFGGLVEKGTLGFDPSAQFVVLHLSILVEESLELAGALIALWATLSYLRVLKTPEGLLVTTND